MIPYLEQEREHILSNIPTENASLALQAAIDTGTKITIGDALDWSGRPVQGHIGLYAYDYRDKGSFWKRYHELMGK